MAVSRHLALTRLLSEIFLPSFDRINLTQARISEMVLLYAKEARVPQNLPVLQKQLSAQLPSWRQPDHLWSVGMPTAAPQPRLGGAQRRKTQVNYHRQHYQDYVKPWRGQQKALKAKALLTAVGEPEASALPSDAHLPPVVLTQHLCAQLTTCVSQCFTRLQQRLRQAA